MFTNGTLVEPGSLRVRRADLVIAGDHIVEIAERARPRGAEVIDCAGKLLMPGLVLGHTHLYWSLALGMPPPKVAPRNFREGLERGPWRLDRALDAETISLSAEVGAIAAARAGVTTLFDHHASPSLIEGSLEMVACAVERVGLRGVLCYEVSDRGGIESARAAIAENDRYLGSLDPHIRPLLRGMVGAHAGFTLGHATSVALVDLTVRHGVGVHIHVAEDECDARHIVPMHEASIVEWLAAYRMLGPRALLAHCVHVDDAGAEEIAESGAFVVHNPRSNMQSGVGYARPARFGAHTVLGTDGLGADLFAESQVAFQIARAHHHPFDPLAALARGYKLAATAFDRGLGRLEPGCPADLILLDYAPPTPLASENLLEHFLHGMSAARVNAVFVNGRPVMRERRLVNVDEAAVMARAREAAVGLWRRMGGT